MRYAGQGFEVQVELPTGPIGADFGAAAKAAFNQAYLQKHKFLDPEARIEAVDWSLAATLPQAQGEADMRLPQTAGREPHGRQVWFPEMGGYADTRIIERQFLGQGETIAGPAIVEDPDSTAVILPGDVGRLSGNGHLIIDIAEETAP
jgi:N-methylhydantoinase A